MPRPSRPSITAFRHFLTVLVLFSAVPMSCGGQVPSRPESRIDPWVLAHTEGGRIAEFLVLLADQADLSAATALPTKLEKGRFVRDTLWNKAQRTQAPIHAWLRERGLDHRSFYIVNMIRVTGDRAAALELAARPDVWRVEGNPLVRGLVHDDRPAADAAPPAPLTVEPGIAFTNAPSVWAMGYTGQGVVLAGQDTGYNWNHPAILGQYRGWNGSVANHDYNWHDSIHSGGGSCGANNPAPCDDNSHGTHTMGTAVGDDGAGNQIGMAPGAQWIGSRDMDQGNGTPATYIESFEFFLAPYPVAGTTAQGNPALAPDVTTNSWLCPPSEGCSANALLLACQVQRAAGIMSVFAAGNSGSGCSTVNWPPAIYAEVTSVGALQGSTDGIASFSSRGPVTVDGSNRRKPDIAARGTSVRSCVLGTGYASYSGTSMATPHVAGAVALLWSAHPALKNDIPATEAVLQDTAVHISSSSCGSSGWPNNVFGYGRLDVLAAVNAVYSATLTPPTTSAPGTVGGNAIVTLTLTNTSYIQDTYNLAVTGGTFAAGVSPATVGPIPAGGTASVTVTIQVPAGATFGSMSSSSVTATSQAWASVTPQAQVTITAEPVIPVLALSQPGGPGAGVVIDDSNLVAGHEYFNVFSGDLCPGGPGTGVYLGLCALDPALLIGQVLVPVGTIPFHFAATAATAAFGPFILPPGITVDGVCFDLTANQLGGISSVVRYTIQ